MKKLPMAIAASLISFGFASTASSATYIVQAKAYGFDSKLAAKVESAGGVISARLPQIGIAIVESDSAGFSSRVEKIVGIRSAVLDKAMQFDQGKPVEVDASEDYGQPPNAIENDSFYNLQWGHAAVDAAGAWNSGYRGAGVRVAVLDSGIFCNHIDIDNNLDLAASASFVPGEPVCNVAGNSTHGTHTAGTIGAEDNGVGTIGIAPLAKVIAVKVLSARSGSGSFAGIIQGIVYAADQGADVINMSLGARGGLDIGGREAAELINATARATRYAEKQNALIVTSAGNDGRDLDHDSGRVCDNDGVCTTVNLTAFPAELPATISISATAPIGWVKAPSTTFLDNLASYSNYGSSGIDFAGPGGDFSYPGTDNCALVVGARPCWIYDMVMSLGSGPTGYAWNAGTSMAAPHVSGVAALIIGKNGGEMSPAQVKQILRSSSDDLGKPGQDDVYGYGRVNAAKAVQ